jgi:hypothetical protein
MTRPSGPAGVIERRVRFACILALVALALVAWSLVDPAPLPVIGAMTIGQALGVLSFGFFLFAIVADLRPALRRLRAQAEKTAGAGAGDTDPPAPRSE